jgi:hypothetical protein
MRETVKRHTLRAIRTGKVALPKSLHPIKFLNFITLLERKKNGRRKWAVELSAKTAKEWAGLFDELEQVKKQHVQLTEEHSSLSKRFSDLRARNELLEKNLEQLRDNIEQDRRPPRADYVKSPIKNSLGAFEANGHRVTGPPIQGGLPGLGKRR